MGQNLLSGRGIGQVSWSRWLAGCSSGQVAAAQVIQKKGVSFPGTGRFLTTPPTPLGPMLLLNPPLSAMAFFNVRKSRTGIMGNLCC